MHTPISAFLTDIDSRTGDFSFSTYFGGDGEDSAWGVAVDRPGSIYILGHSNSPNLTTTRRAFQPKLAGQFDLFLAKFEASGRRLLYSTYFGGTLNDLAGFDGRNLIVDEQQRAWFVGMTESVDLPLRNPLQRSFGGGDLDGLIAAFTEDGSALEYATYYGGSGRDLLEGLAIGGEFLYATGVSFAGEIPFVGATLPNKPGTPDAILSALRLGAPRRDSNGAR